MSGLELLYQEVILDHARRRHGSGRDLPDGRVAIAHRRNSLCGDEMIVRVRLSASGNAVTHLAWEGVGCSISLASASMLATLFGGRDHMTRADASALAHRFSDALRSRGEIVIDKQSFGDAAALSDISGFSARIKCALLAWATFADALASDRTRGAVG